jgi:hypothetical protein
MSHHEISETFLRMGAITRRFLAAVNYRGTQLYHSFHGTPSRPPAPPRLFVPTRHRRRRHGHPSRQLFTRRALPLGCLR